MTVYQDDRILILTMKDSDPQALFEAVRRQGWHADLDYESMRCMIVNPANAPR